GAPEPPPARGDASGRGTPPAWPRAAPAIRSAAGEPSVGDAVRPGGLGAEAIDLVLLVGLEVPLEPEPVRAALPGEDVRGDPVQEPPVVTGDHRAAGKL